MTSGGLSGVLCAGDTFTTASVDIIALRQTATASKPERRQVVNVRIVAARVST